MEPPSHGRYLSILGGSTASVDEALQEGLYWGKEHVIDYAFLPDIVTNLHNAVLGKRYNTTEGALSILETATISSSLQAAEYILKGTPVTLIELRTGDPQMGGRGLTLYQGELHDISEATEIASAFLQNKGTEFTQRILTSPHEIMIQQVNASTSFEQGPHLEFKGEL